MMFDLKQGSPGQGQEGVDSGSQLPDITGPEQKFVGYDLGIGGNVA